MDPVSDPPPLPDQPTADVTATATGTAAAANPTPSQTPAHNHPPYAEMIAAAISVLKERNGSSKRAIAKYIETNYSDLPSTHAALLTHHLKRLKTSGQLLMVKHSYKLPRSVPVPAPVNGAVNAVSSDPASAGPKRRPGRPPKPKPNSVQVAVPVFEPPINMNAVPVDVPGADPQRNVAIEPVNGAAAAVRLPVRGRGRPPKHGGLKRGLGRPSQSGGGPSGGVGVGRGRGRPQIAAPASQVRKGPGRPRGRPPKPFNAAAAAGGVPVAPGAVGVHIPAVVASVVRKRGRGRPPKAGGEAKRPRNLNAGQPRKLSGKPLGRPKKNPSATAVNRSPDSQLLVAYLDLKAKLENLQSRICQTANLIKPSLNNEAAINALQELELIAMNVTTAPVAQNHLQPQPQPQPQQQYLQQPPQC